MYDIISIVFTSITIIIVLTTVIQEGEARGWVGGREGREGKGRKGGRKEGGGRRDGKKGMGGEERGGGFGGEGKMHRNIFL